MQRLLTAALMMMAVACNPKKDAPSPPSGAIVADDKGFTPSSVTLKKGGPGKLTFFRTTDETCATEVVFPELGLKQALPKGTPVTIDVPTAEDRKLTFQCGMGMYKSAVLIQ
jgi:plastocyanin domain-containing protein